MNRISRYIIVAFSAVVTLVSCTKEQVGGPEGNGLLPQGQVREIAVSFGESTKTVLGTTVGTTFHKYKPAFCVGNKIKVSNTTKSEDCVVADVGGVLKIFTNLEGQLTAIYPASAANVTGTAPIPETDPWFKISTTQSGKFSDANICAATIAADGTAASFENQTALLRFYVDASIGVEKITITGTADIATEGTNKKVITVDPEGTALISTVTEDPDKRICYVAILPGANTLTFESVTTVQGQGTVSNTMKTGFNYAQNGIFNAFIPYYIDMGDAGKWGYCNIGAFLPEEYGKYFQWGGTTGHECNGTTTGSTFKDGYNFQWSNAPFNGGQSHYDATEFNKVKETACPGGVLSQVYDAAYHKNNSWCMPIMDEFNELAKSCFAEWTDSYNGTGVNGVIFWKPKTGDAGWFKPATDGKGRKIKDDGSGYYKDAEDHTFSNTYDIVMDSYVFFPTTGYGDGSALGSPGSYGHYWSSSLVTSTPSLAYALFFHSDGLTSQRNDSRYYGFSVRPIYGARFGVKFDEYDDRGEY